MDVRTVVITSAAALVLCGCSRYEAFAPTQQASAVSLDGYRAAEYEVETAHGDLGDVKVWSMGAKKVRYADEQRTLLHVGLEIQNTSDGAIWVDPGGLRLEVVVLDDEMLQNIEVSHYDGPTRIDSADAEMVDAFFAMPNGIDPDDLDAFRVKWTLVGEADQRGKRPVYAQWTHFMEQSTLAYGYPANDPYGWYAPYGYGPYGTYPYGSAYPYVY